MLAPYEVDVFLSVGEKVGTVRRLIESIPCERKYVDMWQVWEDCRIESEPE